MNKNRGNIVDFPKKLEHRIIDAEKEINIKKFWRRFRINNLLNMVNNADLIRLVAFLFGGFFAIFLTTTTGSVLFYGIVPSSLIIYIKIAGWAAFIGTWIDFAWNSILPAFIFLMSAFIIIAVSIFVKIPLFDILSCGFIASGMVSAMLYKVSLLS